MRRAADTFSRWQIRRGFRSIWCTIRRLRQRVRCRRCWKQIMKMRSPEWPGFSDSNLGLLLCTRWDYCSFFFPFFFSKKTLNLSISLVGFCALFKVLWLTSFAQLGHYGLCVQSFESQLEWYTRTFNFAPTDFLYIKDEAGKQLDVAVFAHIDVGPGYTDHHTFFMSTNKTSHVHHCSFEVHDFDTQNLGHEWLASKGYKSVWGVGRHILGSQLFDYWWDTTGNMIEHYADGDLVNEETPVGWGLAGDESLAVWGPEVPKWFLE